MIRTVLCGIAGRMGREISALALEAADIKIIGGIETTGHAMIGKGINDVMVYDDLIPLLPETDGVVEFTNPAATLAHMEANRPYKRAFVIGTTGFSDDALQTIHDLARIFPILLAPNMSVGVNHLYGLVGSSSKVLADYDIEVIETHHRHKKDAPSGTAHEIVRVIKEHRPHIRVVNGRQGMTGERSPHEICVHAVRGGDIAGEHRVVFYGDGEFVELRHVATSRRCFAAGALKALRFVCQQKNGLYSMASLVQ